MFGAERKGKVFGQRLAFEGHGAKEESAPKGVHGRKVVIPVHFGEVIENRAEERVGIDLVVEGVHERFDVSLCRDIVHDQPR